MARHKTGGWGYKLDYDKEITQDEVIIRRLEAALTLLPLLTEVEKDWLAKGHILPITSIIIDSDAKRLEVLGVTEEQRLCIRLDDVQLDIPDGTIIPPNWSRVCKDTLDRVSAKYGETLTGKEKEYLKGTKAALARHKRNKAKYCLDDNPGS